MFEEDIMIRKKFLLIRDDLCEYYVVLRKRDLPYYC